MTITLLVLVFIIFVAIIFDIMYGFHDAANSIATVVSTTALKPQTAVLWAAFFTFIAIFFFAPKVANTISNIVKIESSDPVFVWVIFSGLVGAILWDFFTWYHKLPTSSAHALIGGLSGAGIAHAGFDALRYDLLLTTLEFMIISPLIGFAGAFFIMLSNCWLFRNAHPLTIDRFFKKCQLVSVALYSIGHGANDAQKTMGVIMAVLIAAGALQANEPLSLTNPKTWWIIVLCNLAIAFGTALGGWRIVKTMGMRITRLKPMGGFSAETAGAFSIFLATYAGIPISTTQTITTSIIGVGLVTARSPKINWKIIIRILWAWIFTIPASAIIGASCFYLLQK